MHIPRSCGVILHITSLPSPYGIGDLGPSAYRFADFLESASVRYWQILPLNYTDEGSGFSPYSGLSAFAGNTFLISPELLLEEGLLDSVDVKLEKPFNASSVDFSAVVPYKRNLFDVAYQRFKNAASPELFRLFKRFCKENREWLEDFALYLALKTHFDGKGWSAWPEAIKTRQPAALNRARADLHEEIEKQQFLQFIFFRQWSKLKKYCEDRKIQFIGDLPFYVGHDSSDVWAHPHFFKLNGEMLPLAVAGVPPDYFSKTGQWWGMPVFDWPALKKDQYAWWIQRIEQNMNMFGLLRLDHFLAFSAYWEIPATEKTAMNGAWMKGPGNEFFVLLKKKCPDMPFIAEDLGEIDQPVRDLMVKFNLPGMRVLQFAFGSTMPQSPHIPHHYVPNCIAYTGTHDNNTVVGWFENELTKADKKRVREYLGKTVRKEHIHEEMIRLALQSVAQLAVFPLQDLFGLDQGAIMNRPSTTEGNWSWRFSEGLLTEKEADKIKKWLELYDREGVPEKPKKSAANKSKEKQVKRMALN